MLKDERLFWAAISVSLVVVAYWGYVMATTPLYLA